MDKVLCFVYEDKQSCIDEAFFQGFVISLNELDEFLKFCKENHKFVQVEYDFTMEEK